jgi:hypothetical protein
MKWTPGQRMIPKSGPVFAQDHAPIDYAQGGILRRRPQGGCCFVGLLAWPGDQGYLEGLGFAPFV